MNDFCLNLRHLLVGVLVLFIHRRLLSSNCHPTPEGSQPLAPGRASRTRGIRHCKTARPWKGRSDFASHAGGCDPTRVGRFCNGVYPGCAKRDPGLMAVTPPGSGGKLEGKSDLYLKGTIAHNRKCLKLRRKIVHSVALRGRASVHKTFQRICNAKQNSFTALPLG